MARKESRARRGKVTIDQKKCVGCSYCKLNCPASAIAVEDALAQVNGDCTLCGLCPWVCPVNAITIS
jgi:Fe-S-cluster-containing hydrogenase component 2